MPLANKFYTADIKGTASTAHTRFIAVITEPHSPLIRLGTPPIVDTETELPFDIDKWKSRSEQKNSELLVGGVPEEVCSVQGFNMR